VPHTAHTLNKVPIIVADYSGRDGMTKRIKSGRLADIAPTILDILNIKKPVEMDGVSLFINENEFEKCNPRLQDGKRMVRPPREGNVDAGTVE